MMPLTLAALHWPTFLSKLTGVRFFIAVLLAAPLAYWALEGVLRRRFPDTLAESESTHGRDYYLGFTVGRHLRSEDVDGLVRLLRQESYRFQLAHDDGGEKVFVARELPQTRTGNHELEAGLLSGGLFRATRSRFEVEEERCAAKGDGYCKFVAIRG